MEKVAVFPGSFDPFTIGHLSIVERALPLFDKIIIAIGHNSAKKYLFPIEKRKAAIEELFGAERKIMVMSYDGLTVDFCRKYKSSYILRGLRTSADFEFERAIAQSNRTLDNEIETIFILTLPEHTHIHSSIVRDIFIHGGDVSTFLPASIVEYFVK